MINPTACRLCDGVTDAKFSLTVLERYPTTYMECRACGSLQTERPHWLSEAYAIPGVHVDVGQAARVVQTWLRLCFLLRIIDFPSSSVCVDYGGSAGLLTRLMRDSGYSYFSFDLYDGSKYANYFRVESLREIKPALISAFEVIEHFPEPRESFTEMLEGKPDLLLFTTQFYEQQGPDWPYLVPFIGQHVFFYTVRALEQVAQSFGYELIRWDVLSMLVSPTYAEALKTAAYETFDAAFVGGQVMRVGWGSDKTASDAEYAYNRFLQELRAKSS